MKSISLKTKITATLLAGLSLVFTIIVSINYNRQETATTDLYERNLDDQQWALHNQIEILMLTAENDRLQPLVEAMAARGMVKELQIIDGEQKIARATDRSTIGDKASDPLWSSLFASGRDTVIHREINNEPLEIAYTLMHNETACQDCHDVSEKILGGVRTVSSREMLAATLDQSFWTNIWVSVVGGLILLGGLMALLFVQIFRPLSSVQARLAAASDGDTGQEIATDRRDEIGSLMQAIQRLILYIRDYAGVAGKVAAGDLSADIPIRSERDQLGKAFTDMSRSLDRMIKDLGANAGEMVAAAGTTASSAEQMSRNSSQQTAQIEQISAGIEQMVSTIHSSTEHAQTANDIAGRASNKATEGRQIVTDTVAGMQAIRDIVQQTAQSVTELSKSAEDIGTVTQVIDDIADQTNLLALNAAIEAARAGEQGRGFAVVADEVRKLADQTRKATQEIADKIQGIQQKTTAAVHEMEDGIIQVAAGTQQAAKAGESLEEIVILAEQVSGMIAQIASSSEEQNTVAQDIARNMTNVSNAAREFASGATESAGIAEQLNGQADGLQQMVQRFKVRS